MTLETFLFKKGFKPDTTRTKVLAVAVALIINPTDNDMTLQQEISLMLGMEVNNVAQHLYWIKDRYNKIHNDDMINRTPLEVVYKLAYEYKDIINS